MDLKDILVFLDEGLASEGRLELAANIAHDHRACLSAVFMQDDRVSRPLPALAAAAAPWLGMFAGPPLSGAIDTAPGAVLADIAEQKFRERHRCINVEGDWHPIDGTDLAELITLARSADLVIIGQVNPNARPTPVWRPEEIVLSCGRPVLMVPYIGSYSRVGRRVLVAWDGSREAVRALNDALPLISDADAVTVMTVRARAKDLDHDSASTERILRHLARHGIAARADKQLQAGTSISDVLLSRSVDLAADLIVAGAYHHSQLRETLLGGVSRELFHHMTLPVLMSH
jgi:nucleotide-binding universal stress UspA family protein